MFGFRNNQGGINDFINNQLSDDTIYTDVNKLMEAL